MRRDELKILKSCDTYKELLSAESRPNLSMFYNSGKHEEQEPDYCKWLITLFKEAILEHRGKRKVVDDDLSSNCHDEHNSGDEDLDPQYENFLGCLKEYDNSYAIVVENGSPELLKYEEDEEEEEDLEVKCVPKPRKMVLRSSTKRSLENLDRPSSLSQVKETPAERISSGRVVDPDYQNFLNKSSFMGDTISFAWKNQTMVYGSTNVGNGQKQGNNDESDSDVEIIDKPSSDGLRQEVLALLRKPYDDKEYRTLMRDIEKRKPVLKHKDLTCGREMFVPLDKLGKSLLDRNPDLKTKLESTDDLPTRLNLLRGFFFHIQYLPHEGIFCPWQDTECLSVKPGSC